jgi:glycine cleavage system protein P-like pyridoxal-binding family
MLIEPTESETLEELDRFCDAMIQIRKEAEDVITGKQPKDNNVLKHAPHTVSVIGSSEWNRYAVFSFCTQNVFTLRFIAHTRANKPHIPCHFCAKRNFGPLYLGSMMVR